MPQDKENIYREALYNIMSCNRLDIAKEVAADVLEEDLEEFTSQELEEIDFMDDEFDGDIDYSLFEGEY